MNIDNVRGYLLSFNIFMFAQGLVAVFLNIFFFQTGGYLPVLYFQLSYFVLAFVAFILSGYLMTRYYPRQLFALGEVFFVLMLGMIFLTGTFLSNVLIFGAIYGIATGTFYAGNNLLMFDITTKRDRTSFVSTNNMITELTSFAAPLVAGLLIQYSNLQGTLKFLWDFSAAMVLFVVSAVAIMRIREKKDVRSKFSIRDTFIGKINGYLKFNIYTFSREIFIDAFNVILPIYVFQLTHSYVMVGILVSYIVVLSLASNLAFRKGIRKGGYFANLVIAGTILSSLFIFLNFNGSNLLGVFLFAGAYTLFSTPLDNLVLVEYMNFIGKRSGIDRIRFWMNREYYLTFARILIFGGLILVALSAFNTLDFIRLFPFLSIYGLVYYIIVKDSKPNVMPAGHRD